MKQDKLKLILLWGLAIMATLVIVTTFGKARKAAQESVQKEEKTKSIEHEYGDITGELLRVHELGGNTPTPCRVFLLMDILAMEHPNIVYAQMLLESGNFESRLARENKNYFGMKHPVSRLTTSLGAKDGYANYKNWAHSVLDYAIWQRTFASGLTEEQYFKLLGERYAEDVQYCQKVKNIVRSTFNE